MSISQGSRSQWRFWVLVKKNVFLVENSISFKNACCVSKDIISDLETGRLTVLTPCSKMREQVKLRAPSINTEEMIKKIFENFLWKVLSILSKKYYAYKTKKRSQSKSNLTFYSLALDMSQKPPECIETVHKYQMNHNVEKGEHGWFVPFHCWC